MAKHSAFNCPRTPRTVMFKKENPQAGGVVIVERYCRCEDCGLHWIETTTEAKHG